ncbi:hypothetical protein QA601_12305 [Chitinispirillales bacterium ANBcel5]|uniref:hypothetical protein n=1 Tax=Cellulosispirillum alkaliphilum TaxID=3039283 RepID=UPI002A592365|nr:hypothetical protein [Chitinispirillales bacterium ANBcel5]
MILWIKRFAWVISVSVFFATLLISMDFSNFFNLANVLGAVIKAMIAASFFWFVGFIFGDIFVKGLIGDIPFDKKNLVEGGLLQNVTTLQLRLQQNESEIKYMDTVDPKGKKGKRKRKKKAS